jgi:hypothetical protein
LGFLSEATLVPRLARKALSHLTYRRRLTVLTGAALGGSNGRLTEERQSVHVVPGFYGAV